MEAKDVFNEWNAYAKQKELKARKVDFDDLEKNSSIKIIAITGIRRAGKTSLLILFCQSMLKKGKKAAYINLEDDRLKGKASLLDDTVKWFGDEGYLLLDEITGIDGWDGWLARNHEMLKGKLNLFVSSSRKSLIMPKRPLRGRMLSYENYPLSFNEFLAFNGINIEATTAGAGKIEDALEDYLVYGGFPEAVLSENKTDKIRLISSYFRDILGLDVAEASKEDIIIVDTFGRYAIETSYFSASKCLNFFKSVGHKIGKGSILKLEKYSQMAYLFFFVPIYSHNIKDKSQYPRKAYLGDTGFLYALAGRTDWGRLYENAVFLELKRRSPISAEINYWKNKDGLENDFVIREGLGPSKIIQVVYDVENESTKEREVAGLVECAKEFKLKEGLIITRKYSGAETVEGIKIRFIPLWRWLLERGGKL